MSVLPVTVTLNLNSPLPTKLVAVTTYSPAFSGISEVRFNMAITGAVPDRSGLVMVTLFSLSTRMLPLCIHVMLVRGRLNFSMDAIKFKTSPAATLGDPSWPLPSAIVGETRHTLKPQ